MVRQPSSYEEWVRVEGGIERPTHLETLRKPEQQARIKWLKEHCNNATEILDVGCNWGYVLNELGGKRGIDINPENIEKAEREFPLKYWEVGDVTKGLRFTDSSYAVVVLADVVEHIDWEEVDFVLGEVLRVARKRVLITLPWRRGDDCVGCFKHKWHPDVPSVGSIVVMLTLMAHKVNLECDGNFLYLDVEK